MKGYIKFNREYFELDISDTSKLIYALMISREEWCSKQSDRTKKEIRMQYTIAELMRITKHSKQTIISSIQELESKYLVYVYKEPGKPNKYEMRSQYELY